jgi:RimJ/RimL family protein N-acetyltransferase
VRAIGAYKKCGFVEEARLRLAQFSDGAFHDALIMAVLRSEFEALNAGRETEEVMR